MSKLTIICGPMFAAKTSTLISRVKRLTIAKQDVLVFKPKIDDRYGSDSIKTHEKTDLEERTNIKPISITNPYECLPLINNVKHLFFDEIQFFDKQLMKELIKRLLLIDKEIVCFGLDLTSAGETFGAMGDLMALANEVQKLTAVCSKCFGDATRTYKKGGQTNDIVLGAEESYEARCYKCWNLNQ